MPIELPVEFTFPNVASSANKALRELGRSVKGTTIGLKDVAATATIVAGAFAAASTAVKAFFDDITETVDEANTLAAATGLAAESIQGLRQAARASGKQLKDIVPKNLAKQMLAAADAGGATADAFRRANVEFKNTDGTLRDANEVFPELISGLASMENRTEAAAVAAKILEKQGRELLTAFADSEQFKAFVELSKEFGIDVGPDATKASEGWQKATSNLAIAFDNMKQKLLDSIGGQEAVNKFVQNASQNIVFLTELTANSFRLVGEQTKAFFFNIKELGRAFKALMQGQKGITVQLREFGWGIGVWDKTIKAAAISAVKFGELAAKAGRAGASGFSGLNDELDDTSKSLESLAEKLDLTSIIEADLALSKVLEEQWKASASEVEKINAAFKAQKVAIEELVSQGADREDASNALLQLEWDRVAALDAAYEASQRIQEQEEERIPPSERGLAIARATVSAMQGISALGEEIWIRNQANNKELDKALSRLDRNTTAKKEGLEADLEALEIQLKQASTDAERSRIQEGIADLKNSITELDDDAEKRAKKLKKNEEARLEDTFKDMKKFQVATTIAAGATASVQAFAQLGPIAGAAAAAGIIATTIAQSLAKIRSQAPSFHIGGNPFQDSPLPSFSAGPDERTVTVTQNEIKSPYDKRKSEASSASFTLPLVLNSQVLDTLVYTVATGTGRTGKLIRGGQNPLVTPTFTGN